MFEDCYLCTPVMFEAGTKMQSASKTRTVCCNIGMRAAHATDLFSELPTDVRFCSNVLIRFSRGFGGCAPHALHILYDIHMCVTYIYACMYKQNSSPGGCFTKNFVVGQQLSAALKAGRHLCNARRA